MTLRKNKTNVQVTQFTIGYRPLCRNNANSEMVRNRATFYM